MSPLRLVPHRPRKACVITSFGSTGLLFDLISYPWRKGEISIGYNDPLDFHGRAGVGTGSQRSAVCV